MLDLTADWPLSSTEQIAGLIGGVTPRRANQVLNQLRRRSLSRRNGKVHVLTGEGLTTLARRHRDRHTWVPGLGPLLLEGS